MKKIIFIFSVCLPLCLPAQDVRTNFHKIDWSVRSIDAADPVTLSRLLTEGYTSELEKVRSIFRWITENISYRVSVNRPLRVRQPVIQAEEDTCQELQPLNDIIAESVIAWGSAYCEGYARLFKSLCDHAGIRAEVVQGYARTGSGRLSDRFRSNHSWNAVMISGQWHLLDVTWASGFISYYGNEFIRSFDEYYFLTPPAQLIRSHYPDELRWTLLPDPPAIPEYRHSPFRQKAFAKYNITSFTPSKGLIEAFVGDTVQLILQSNNPERDQRIAPSYIEDSTVFTAFSGAAFLQPEMMGGGKYLYRFVVQTAQIQWLHLMYNDDPILRYRLNIKDRRN